MRIFVITKRNLLISAAVLAAFIVCAIAFAFSCGGGHAVENKPEKTGAAEPAREAASAAQTAPRTGLLSSEDIYEADVLAGLHKELPVYSVERSDGKIALTIDAAWDDDKTPFILETLSKYNVKATFFLCGSWVTAYPDQVLAIHRAGHSIGNHSMTHPHMSELTEERIKKEISDLDDVLQSITGERSTLFRAPFGEYNDGVILAVRASGHEPIQWDIDTIDWKPERSSQTILDSVLPKLHDGAVILCHNNGYKIEEYLPTLIETAQANGYSFVTVDELLLGGETMIDVNGVQKLK